MMSPPPNKTMTSNQPKMNRQAKPVPSVWRVLLKMLFFFLDIIFATLAAKRKRHRPYSPTLQETAMGEPIPMSDQYYIPDDKYKHMS